MRILFAAALFAALCVCSAAGGAPLRWNPYAPIGTVNPDGSVTKATGPGTFDRFVQGKSQCLDFETDMPTWSAAGVYLGRACRFQPSGH
ncbi:MAG TPA: hypothetical protein VGH40_15100 [Roseiarcus sp.]|jgi:hypothetical protein